MGRVHGLPSYLNIATLLDKIMQLFIDLLQVQSLLSRPCKSFCLDPLLLQLPIVDRFLIDFPAMGISPDDFVHFFAFTAAPFMTLLALPS